MQNRLSPISNHKMKKQKARMTFSNHLFLFWDQFNYIKVFPLFRTNLDSWKISSESVWSRKISMCRQKKFFLSNVVPRVSSFYKWTKSRLKYRVTTVHLLQRKTNFFIRLCVWRRNLCKLKKFFDSFTLINIRLHSSTFF